MLNGRIRASNWSIFTAAVITSPAWALGAYFLWERAWLAGAVLLGISAYVVADVATSVITFDEESITLKNFFRTVGVCQSGTASARHGRGGDLGLLPMLLVKDRQGGVIRIKRTYFSERDLDFLRTWIANRGCEPE